MKILFCWSDVSGYMAACWRYLSKLNKYDIHIIISEKSSSNNIEFSINETLSGLSYTLLNENEIRNYSIIKSLAYQINPDVFFISGWNNIAYRKLVKDNIFRNKYFIMALDNPLKYNFKQKIGRIILRPYLEKISHVIVAGERAWQYAKFLGFKEEQISRGIYAFDYDKIAEFNNEKNYQSEYPKSFLFVGRYVPEKNIAILVKAYQLYQKKSANPWPLNCCGTGPLKSLLKNINGINDLGFRQPDELFKIFYNNGVFVLPSKYDPWGVVVAEAAACGKPIICTEACGASVDLVKHLFNGYVVPTSNEIKLAQAMLWMENNYYLLQQIGERSKMLSEPYSSKYWAKRIEFLLENI